MDARHLIAFILLALMIAGAVGGLWFARYNSPHSKRRRERARDRAARR